MTRIRGLFLPLAIGLAVSVAFAGCSGGGGGGGAADGADLADDARDAAADAGTEDDVLLADLVGGDGVGPDGADGKALPDTPDAVGEPTLACALLVRDGERALTGGPIALGLADEPTDYAAAPGFQLDVRARATGVALGARASLRIDGQLVGDEELEPEVDGSLAVTLPAVTVPHAPNGVSASLELRRGGAVLASCVATLRVDLGPCPVELQPAPTACLLNDQDPAPGFQRRFTVRSAGGACDRASLAYQTGGGTSLLVPAVALDANGEAAFLLTLFPSSAALDNEAVLVTGIVTDSANPSREAQTTPQVYTIDSEAPAVVVEAPLAGDVTVADDADGNPDNGLQLVVSGRARGVVPGDGAALTLLVDGTPEGLTDVAADGTFAFPAVTFVDPGTHALEVAGRDTCGQQGSAALVVSVFPVLPDLAIVSPTDGAALWARDDGDPATLLTYETTFTVQARGVAVGTTLTARCRRDTAGAPLLDVGSLVIGAPADDDRYDVPVALRADLQGPDQVCTAATDGPTAATSAPAALWVALPAPRLSLLAPAEDALRRDDVLVVTGTALNLSGRPLELHLDDEAGVPVIVSVAVTPILSGTFSGSLPLDLAGQPVADGRYRVWVDATDALGNVASEQAASDVSAWITLDRTAPVVTFDWPPAELNPATDPLAEDVSAAPGYQADVRVRVGGEPATAGIEVCLWRERVQVGCVTLGAGEDVAVFEAVTLQPGGNLLTATAEDGAGNHGNAAPWPVHLALDAPRITFVEPPPGLVTTQPTITVVLEVTDPGGLGPIDGATVLLVVADVLLAQVPAALGDGRYRFVNVPLSEGETILEGRATAGGTEGSTGPFPVVYKVDAPTIAFTTPTDGAVLTLATTACEAAQADCLLTVRLLATNLEDGAGATLTVDCGDGPTGQDASAAGGAVAFAGVLLPDGTTCVLRATATDVVGQTAVAGPITVTVDRTAPVIERIDLPAVLQTGADLRPEEPGMQVNLTVLLGGAEAGQRLQVHVENSVGEAFDYGVDLPSTVPDGVTTPLTLGVVTLPEEFVEVTADVSDRAGNPAVSARHSVYVNSEVPDVRVLLPVPVDNDPCTTSADCDAGGICGADGCGRPWSAASTFLVEVGLQGIANGEDVLRVCSDHAAFAAAPACAAGDGFHEVVRADVTGAVSAVSLETLLPEGFQRLAVEAEALPGSGEWISSVDNAVALYRERAVYVDTVPPTVVAVTSPSDAVAPEGVLNAAEQAEPGRRYRLRVEASEDGSATLYLNGLADGSGPLTGGAGELTATLPEGANQVQARATDLVGNASSLGPTPAFAVTVDTIAPTLRFLAPQSSPLLAGADLDVVLQSDAVGQPVALMDGVPPAPVGFVPVAADGRAVFDHAGYHALSDGAHQLSATVADASGNETVAVTSPAIVEVDVVPPTLVVSAPVSGRVFGDDDDADPDDGGFQVAVSFTPSGASEWSLDLASGCDLDHANCDAPVVLGTGAAADVAVQQTITVPVSGETTHHVLGVAVRDPLGNTVRQSVPFSLVLTRCVVTVAGLPTGGVYNNNRCVANPGRDCPSVSETLTVGYTPACAGADALALFKDGVEIGRSTDVASGSADFAVTWQHADQFALSARALTGAVVLADSGDLPVRVDLSDPVPLFAAAVVDGFPTPASGSTPLYGSADDQRPETPETVEIHAQITATDDVRLAGGRVNLLYRTTGGSSVAVQPTNVTLPQTIAAEPWSLDLKNLALPHGGPHTLRITVADAAGNVASTAFVPTVDVQAPGGVVLEAITAADVDPRRPSVTVRWTAPGEDGGGGAATAGYDVRYAWQPITDDASFEAACPAAELVPGLAIPAPGAPGTPEEFTLDGPDARSPADPCRFVTALEARTLYVAVRAVDDAGNPSPLGAGAVQSTTAVRLRAAALTHQGIATDPGTEGDIDFWVWSVGDMDGDGLEDMALGGFSAAALCVVYGHADDPDGTVADYLLDGATGPHHVCVVDSGASYLGFSTARPIDVNGDGLKDLVVGRGSRFPFAPFDEEVRVYLGRAGQPIATTPNVTIRGMQTFQFTGLIVNSAGNFNGDRTGGRPIEDVVVASDYEGPAGAETGAVYVIPGNAAWNAATNLAIDVASPADRTTYGVARIAVQGTVPIFAGGSYVPPLFGYRVAGAGNVLTDAGETQYDDLLITQRIHRRAVYLVKGRPLTGAVDILVTDAATLPNPPVGEDAQVVRLQPETDVTQSNFGETLLGGVDLDGGGVPDVVATHPRNAPGKNFHVFWGEQLRGKEGQTVRVSLLQPPEQVGDMLRGANGVILSGDFQGPALLGDFDDDLAGGAGASGDLAYGLKSVSDFGEVFVRLNLGLPAVSGAHGYFPYADLVLEDPTGGGSLCFGSTIAGVGDVNGDDVPDLLVGGAGCGTAWLIY